MSETNPEQALCKTCGFCCDGTLFRRAKAEEGENLLPNMEEEYVKDQRFFKMPCECFNGKCSVYGEYRPKICGSFKCKLLNDAIKEKTTFEEAAELVQKVKDQRTKLGSLIPDAAKHSLLLSAWRAFREKNQEEWDTPEFRGRHAMLLMEWVVFRNRLKRFRNEKKKDSMTNK